MCFITEILPTLNGLLTLAIGINTIVIAIIGIYIGIRQYRTGRDQYRLNLYDKRFAVFKATQSFLRDIVKNARVTDDSSAGKFWDAVDDAQFLFKEPVAGYMANLRQQCLHLMICEGRLYGEGRLPVGEERNRVSQENSDLLKWFINQNERLVDVFRKDLRCE
jgi:hypothetical protein